MKMTEKEMRESDGWIAEHVLGWKWYRYKPEKDHSYSGKRTLMDGPHRFVVVASGDEELAPDAFLNVPKSTTDPAAAFAVLQKCAEKRTESWNEYRPDAVFCIYAPRPEWGNEWVVASDAEHTIKAEAETLPLAIFLFAKKLFSEGKKS